MLLILTNSVDGTSDEIVRRMDPRPVFRFNIDLWKDYQFKLTAEGFFIKDPSGRSCHSSQVQAAYVRKPTFDAPLDIRAGGCEEAWTRAQINALTQEIYNWCRDNGTVRLVEKGAQQRCGKFRQMAFAKDFFPVPHWEFAIGDSARSFPGPAIAKTLVADFVEDYRFFYTTVVTPKSLDLSYPWFLQHQVNANADVTVVFVAGKIFSFALDRSTFDGVDWRKHINRESLEWKRFTLPPYLHEMIGGFMAAVGLEFGRIDFLLEGETYHFLEVNPNGQWAWLDVHGSEGIFDAVVQELSRGW